MRRFFFVGIALLIIILDQISKHWCVAHLTQDSPVPFIDHWLYLTLTYNSRGAFSLLSLPNGVFIAVVALLIVGFLVYAARATRPLITQLLIGLILGGGAGNLIDRIQLGSVVDFLDLRFWPVFNVADSAVSAGMTLLLLTHVIPRPKAEESALKTDSSLRSE